MHELPRLWRSDLPAMHWVFQLRHGHGRRRGANLHAVPGHGKVTCLPCQGTGEVALSARELREKEEERDERVAEAFAQVQAENYMAEARLRAEHGDAAVDAAKDR